MSFIAGAGRADAGGPSPFGRIPCRTAVYIRGERHPQLGRAAHLLAQHFGRALFFFSRTFDDQLVVHLQNQAGAQDVFLEVRAQNSAAQALYRSLGFVQTGLRRNFYATPADDAVLMQKTL